MSAVVVVLVVVVLVVVVVVVLVLLVFFGSGPPLLVMVDQAQHCTGGLSAGKRWLLTEHKSTKAQEHKSARVSESRVHNNTTKTNGQIAKTLTAVHDSHPPHSQARPSAVVAARRLYICRYIMCIYVYGIYSV